MRQQTVISQSEAWVGGMLLRSFHPAPCLVRQLLAKPGSISAVMQPPAAPQHMASPWPSVAAALAAHWAAGDGRSWATAAALQLLGLWLRRHVLQWVGLLVGAALVTAELLALVASLRWRHGYCRRLRLPLVIAIRTTITIALPWMLDALTFVQPAGQCSSAAGADPCIGGGAAAPAGLLPAAVLLLLPVAWLVSWESTEPECSIPITLSRPGMTKPTSCRTPLRSVQHACLVAAVAWPVPPALHLALQTAGVAFLMHRAPAGEAGIEIVVISSPLHFQSIPCES